MNRFRRSLRSLRSRIRTSGRAWVTDGLADVADALVGPAVGRPIPPAALRQGVARGPSRDEYLKAGGLAAAEILGFLLQAGVAGQELRRWLDFGCGSGRLSWLLLDSGVAPELVGVDVDEAAVAWCAENLEPGTFRVSRPLPPLDFPDASFDLALAASVFSHFDEAYQFAWLGELARVLRPGGYLLASTHGPDAAPLRPEIGPTQLAELARTGFFHFPGDGRFNDQSSFHSKDYLVRSWSSRFELVRIEEKRLFKFQNLSLWKRRSDAAREPRATAP